MRRARWISEKWSPPSDWNSRSLSFVPSSPAPQPPDQSALYEAKIEELHASFAMEQALSVGAEAPDFVLQNAPGQPVSLSDTLRPGPAVVAFYRGDWCPYCNLQLRAYQAALPDIMALGARLVAISPQLPDGSLSTVEKNELTFDVLSDVGNEVARRFGLVYALPEELRAALRSSNKALPDINGDESWEFPLPATYIIGRDHRVALPFIDVDYRRRLAPEDILAALRSLASA